MLKPPQAREVHVWVANAGVSQSLLATLASNLSSDERNRASKFRFERDRNQYVFSQGVLRAILAAYLGSSGNRIMFNSNSFGKPSLMDGLTDLPLTFNLSHSKGLVIIGVAVGLHLGVDVELVQPLADMESIARQYFTGDEQGLLQTCTAERKDEAFFVCWTRKEAYIKAVGKGLSIPLDSFDVSMPLGSPGRSLPATADLPEVEKWFLQDLTLPSPYVGALVVEGNEVNVSYTTWNQAACAR
jgi:4'-phosphopantetheinyl transferase